MSRDQPSVPKHEMLSVENPSDFLSKLGSELKDSEETDSDLAEILAEYILTASPSPDCVKKASKAITDLAERRAAPGEDQDE